jgi:pimeloyl-ACP methyl ester carboxylesterase
MSEEINPNRRRFLGTAAMTIGAARFGMFGSADAQSRQITPTGATPASPRRYARWDARRHHALGNNANNFNAVEISIPAAITVFPGEIYRAPRSWAERSYHKLIYFHEVNKGGRFAAWEQPELFAAEIRAAFRSLR